MGSGRRGFSEPRRCPIPCTVPSPSPRRAVPGPLSCSAGEGGIEIEIVFLIEPAKRVFGTASTPD